ncbi:phosphonate C-P lyase system protein PhnH [Candidatus Viridilinea mediisalina]|uniref:Phosphonate C-P lyase system protein PhnH n=1 Tax=Candidatus Viridilinea mediisalina TaxID=2024553 RepID=A0A2A6RPV1_9CHLR|nr:phosphonate C-P lyase system protein PhnH [Candidatus Viridilinea mediisalina]PDW04956.1 phosphonate C-P lyase system protein PhnH [Candidatus Viridilinea mediisalina]
MIAAPPTTQAYFNSRTFRILLDSLARPGTLGRLPPPPQGYDLPLLPAMQLPNHYAVAALLSLLDQGTSMAHAAGGLWLSAEHPLTRWFTLRSNAQVETPAYADYVLLHDPASAACLGDLKRGSLTFPEQSCTAFLCVAQLDEHGATWRLAGPGIAGSRTVGIPGLPANVLSVIMATRSDFPLGVDIFCIDVTGACLGLPRTTRIEEVCS